MFMRKQIKLDDSFRFVVNHSRGLHAMTTIVQQVTHKIVKYDCGVKLSGLA